MSEHLEFRLHGKSESGKTEIWRVLSVKGDWLGTIYWYCHWRKYVFEPSGGSLFDASCMIRIAQKCESLTIEHRGKAK